MKRVCYVVSALLALSWVAAIVAGQDADKEASETKPAAEKAPIRRLTPNPEEMQKRVQERLAKAHAMWLSQVRTGLDVESDQEWAKLAPLITRLRELEWVRISVRQKCMMVFHSQGAGGTELMTNADRMVAQLATSNPDLPKEDYEGLATACASLAGTYASKEASEEEIEEALAAVRQAEEEFDKKVALTAVVLVESATPRQRAGLVLLGVLRPESAVREEP